MKQKARTEARDMPQSVHSTVGSSSFLMFLNESNAFIFKNALQFVNLWIYGWEVLTVVEATSMSIICSKILGFSAHFQFQIDRNILI